MDASREWEAITEARQTAEMRREEAARALASAPAPGPSGTVSVSAPDGDPWERLGLQRIDADMQELHMEIFPGGRSEPL